MSEVVVNRTDGHRIELEFRQDGEFKVAAFVEHNGISIHPEDNSELKVGETMTVEAFSMAIWKVIYGKKEIA